MNHRQKITTQSFGNRFLIHLWIWFLFVFRSDGRTSKGAARFYYRADESNRSEKPRWTRKKHIFSIVSSEKKISSVWTAGTKIVFRSQPWTHSKYYKRLLTLLLHYNRVSLLVDDFSTGYTYVSNLGRFCKNVVIVSARHPHSFFIQTADDLAFYDNFFSKMK